MRHAPLARRLGVWGDDLMGYGKPDPRRKWWMDLDELDGELRIPPSPAHKSDHQALEN